MISDEATRNLLSGDCMSRVHVDGLHLAIDDGILLSPC